MSQICKSRFMLSIRLKNYDDDNDRRHKNSRTYSDHPVVSPGCEKFAVWAKTYAPNVVGRSFMDQETV